MFNASDPNEAGKLINRATSLLFIIQINASAVDAFAASQKNSCCRLFHSCHPLIAARPQGRQQRAESSSRQKKNLSFLSIFGVDTSLVILLVVFRLFHLLSFTSISVRVSFTNMFAWMVLPGNIPTFFGFFSPWHFKLLVRQLLLEWFLHLPPAHLQHSANPLNNSRCPVGSFLFRVSHGSSCLFTLAPTSHGRDGIDIT